MNIIVTLLEQSSPTYIYAIVAAPDRYAHLHAHVTRNTVCWCHIISHNYYACSKLSSQPYENTPKSGCINGFCWGRCVQSESEQFLRGSR